jgi:creatinine amidohydrolase
VKTCGGVCLVALSVVERHGHHLPLGTDTYQGRGMLSRVAVLEPVIEFPDYIFTQIPERGISLAPSALTAS